MNCAFNCSIHCVYKMCNPKSGNCTYGCEYGWSGVFCDDDIRKYPCTDKSTPRVTIKV